MTEEEWRPVVGYEDLYRISNLGRLWSTPRRGPSRILNGHVVKGRGYTRIVLHHRGVGELTSIHRLVAAAFCHREPGQNVVRHLDGDATNNRAGNLAWGTQSDNNFDAVRHGTHAKASQTVCAQGHPYTPENTGIRPSGHRYCLNCSRHRKAVYNAARIRRDCPNCGVNIRVSGLARHLRRMHGFVPATR